MYEETFKDFKLVQKVPEELFEKYGNALPEEIITVWKEYGFGTLIGGYLKLINPEDYIEVMNLSYYNAANAIPIMVTAFGDLVVWEKEGMIMLLYKDEDLLCLAVKLKRFWGNLLDEDYTNRKFELVQYSEAVDKHGELAYDECFGYTPLLALGGAKKISNINKVKIIEHIELMTELTGKIE